MGSFGKVLTLGIIRAAGLPHRLLGLAFRKNARRPALDDGTPYARLGDRVRRLAGAWRASGVAPGDRVVIDLPNDAAFVEARLACLWLGAVAVPVPPATGDDRLGWIAEAVGARAYLGSRPDVLPGVPGLLVDPLTGDREAYERALGSAAPLPSPVPRPADGLVTINFTSGTTGEPKGVMSTGRGWGASLYHALRENRTP
ncbi:MAG: long-chain fatty acid--CoA ligase, partial [Candidatus Dadabacteria bacterium]